MSRGLALFLGLIAFLLIAISSVFYVARSNDGPMEIIAGGPFQTGDLVKNTRDWAFVDEYQTIQMQTNQPSSSRTMWIVASDNRVYVLTSYMNSRVGRLWKKWPHRVAKDPSAIIRVNGKLYEMNLVRIETGEVITSVLERFNEKYQRKYKVDEVDNGHIWLFELVPS